MDPLSAIASIIAVTESIFKTVRVAAQVWHAPEELQRLSTELTSLSTITKGLCEQIRPQISYDGGIYILGAHARLERVHETFKQKLSPKHGTAFVKPSFRRRKWITQKHTIEQLRRDVECIKNDLTLHVGIMLLSIAEANMKDHSIVARVEDVQGSQLPVLHEVRKQHDACAIATTACDICAKQLLVYDECSPKSTHEQQGNAYWSPTGKIGYTCHNQPQGMLENSPKFFPEAYVVTKAPQLDTIVFSLTELYRTLNTRVDQYCLMFAQDGRHWKHVIVQVTIALNIRYPQVVAPLLWRQYTSVPDMIESDLLKVLQKAEMYKHATKINIELRTNEKGLIGFNESQARFSEVTEDEEDITQMAKHIEALRYQNLRQYVESEVIILKRRHGFFLVLAQSVLCIEMKMAFTENPMPEGSNLQLWASCLQGLQSAQGCAGVATLEGVVLSDDRTEIRSYLVRAPRQGPLDELLYRATRANAPISWPRRERWIRQLLVIIAELHRRGIFGFLHETSLTTIWVDATDNLQFTNLRSEALNSGRVLRHSQIVPPELRLKPGPHILGRQPGFSYHTDVYNLSHLVWKIAKHEGWANSAVCTVPDCNVRPRYSCTIEHENTHVLTPLSDKQIPNYITEIIMQCRHEAPNQRKSAAELLRLIPLTADLALEEPLESISDYHDSKSGPIDPSCDACGQFVEDIQYHCYVCHNENFDLCSKCVDFGVTCLDVQHILTRRVWKNGIPIHSSTYVQRGNVSRPY